MLLCVAVTALLRPPVKASICIELRALSMAVMSLGPTECDRSARSYSVMGSDADRFGSASLTRSNADVSLRCWVDGTTLEVRSVSSPELWRLALFFFFRLKSLLKAPRRVDFFLCGRLSAVLPEALLTTEYRSVLGGLVRLCPGDVPVPDEGLVRTAACCWAGGVAGVFVDVDAGAGVGVAIRGGVEDTAGAGACAGAGAGSMGCVDFIDEEGSWEVATPFTPWSSFRLLLPELLAGGGGSRASDLWDARWSPLVDGSSSEVGLAIPVPLWRMGNSSSGLFVARLEPGFRMGNSSSSAGCGIGIGPEILPRMEWAGRGRPCPADVEGLLKMFMAMDPGG